MNLYKLHDKPKTLDHHDKAFTAVPSLLRSKLLGEWADYDNIDDWFKEIKRNKAILARTPADALWYATMMQEPFPEGEKVIAADASAAFGYSTEVLQARFPAGEAAMKKNERVWKMYQNHWDHHDRYLAAHRK